MIYPYDNNAKFQGALSECNQTIMTNKAYTKTKIFIVEGKRISFGDCA